MADWLSVRGCVANPLVSLFFHPNTKVTNPRIKSASRAGGTRLQRIILARGCGVGGGGEGEGEALIWVRVSGWRSASVIVRLVSSEGVGCIPSISPRRNISA